MPHKFIIDDTGADVLSEWSPPMKGRSEISFQGVKGDMSSIDIYLALCLEDGSTIDLPPNPDELEEGLEVLYQLVKTVDLSVPPEMFEIDKQNNHYRLAVVPHGNATGTVYQVIVA